MTSTIKVNTILKASGSTLTLGEAGTTVAIASGATTSGMGRTGTVDWQTSSIKTSTFTAVNGEGYFVNTSGGAVTVNLPAGSAGAIVAFADYTRTFQTNNLTINPNGSEKVGGVDQDAKLETEGQTATFVYVDGTEGWINVQENSNSVKGVPPFLNATGGTITTQGNDKIHTFTSPGTFAVTSVAGTSACNVASAIVVAGGGGGGANPNYSDGGRGGGGGAGGFRESKSPVTPYSASPLAGSGITLSAQSYAVSVGAGASGGFNSNGSNSTALGIVSTGGGSGGVRNPAFPGPPGTVSGYPGGSGGGAGTYSGAGSVGSGNTPPVSPSQGNNGGTGTEGSPAYGAGGGGGAGAVGGTGSTSAAGNGGVGVTSSIDNNATARSGGGGGASQAATSSAGSGGGGGGGAGAGLGSQPVSGTAGGANTGGGGGGAGGTNFGGSGGTGGSGVVIIRYKFQ